MASVWTAAAGGAATGGRPRAGWGDDLAAALLGTWVVGGLFMDGWAHVNQPGLETFFSPWHAIFYAGFLVSAVVLARLVARFQRGGRPLVHHLGLADLDAGLGILLLALQELLEVGVHPRVAAGPAVVLLIAKHALRAARADEDIAVELGLTTERLASA